MGTTLVPAVLCYHWYNGGEGDKEKKETGAALVGRLPLLLLLLLLLLLTLLLLLMLLLLLLLPPPPLLLLLLLLTWGSFHI